MARKFEAGAVAGWVLVFAAALGVGVAAGTVLATTGALDVTSDPAPLAAYDEASYYDCPDGSALGVLVRGDRVFLTGKDASGGWVQLRHPFNASERVWMRAAHVTPDAVVELPVVSCDLPIDTATTTSAPAADSTTTSTVVASATTTTVQGTTQTTTKNTTGQGTTPATTPQTTTPPTTPGDTTAPTANANRFPPTIYDSDANSGSCPETATINVQATDNVGVTSVTGTYSGLGGGTLTFAKVSSFLWRATLGPFSGLGSDSIAITITITTRDAANNSDTDQLSVTVTSAGNCVG